MGRYLNTNLCADFLGGRTLRLYRKLRYLITVLRNVPHLAKTPLPLDLHRCSAAPSSPQSCSFVPRSIIKTSRLRHRATGSASVLFLRDNTGVRKYIRAVRFCSTSNRDAFKVGAPIGVLQTALQLSSLGVRLGESFNHVSRHINVYFKGKDVPVASLAGNAGVVLTTPEYLGRSERRGQSQRASRERRALEDKEATQTLKCEEKEGASESQPETRTLFQTYAAPQLFHISSLATRFGESYNYVANHINSAFSRSPAQGVQTQQSLEELSTNRGSTRRHRRRKILKNCTEVSVEAGKAQAKMSSTSNPVESDNVTSNWDEGYLHFARHVNRYFGAKVADEADQELCRKEQHVVQNQFSAQPTSNTQSGQSQLKQEEQQHNPKSPGLFHHSSLTTNFGESYLQMANHINRYFKGQGALEEEVDRNDLREMDPGFAASQPLKPMSLMDCLRHPTTAIPSLLGGYLKVGPWAQSNQATPATAPLEATYSRRVVMSRWQAEEMTRGLIWSLGRALSPDALTACVEALNEHLIRYPSCTGVMWQEKTAVQLLKRRRTYRDNQELQNVLRETLAVMGYVDPVKGRGIRVLSIDGGGTRGVVPLQVLKLLEAETGKPIHQLFDYICGVSTGAVLGFMLGLARFPLEECADMYRRFGSDVFRQNALVGTMKMGWSHSYYSTENWEAILREKMGDKLLIRTARDELSPKVSAVSAVVNWGTSPKAFVFRNYNHTPGCLSRYAGGSGYQMWQAVRASSAAPGYFQEFPLQSDIHQDGGILLNNPCALAVHESRLLWPNQHFQCVLSLGTGRYDNAKRGPTTSTSLRAKINNLIWSATDTEGVHTLLDDLLLPDVYFRFNPMLSAEVALDESSPGAMGQLQKDTQNYLERNRPKLARLCLVLGAERSAVSQTKDWVSERAWEMKQRWV